MALKFLKTPPPHVVLLPDTQFFVRAIPVPDAKTAEEVAAQVELALESTSPFPIAQMYYGHHWLPGAKHALAYAAYRKRFNAASVESWPAADAVLPAFATLLNPAARPATTAILNTPDTITAIHWADNNGVPDQVISRSLPQPAEDAPPLTEEQLAAARSALRNELIRSLPGTTHLYEYEYPALDTLPPPARADNALVFATPLAPSQNTQTTPQTTTFTTAQLDALDVRDKVELTARRASRRRDLMLWRVFLGCLGLLALCALIDIAVLGGKFWQDKRALQVRLQAGPVAEIDRANTLATRIEDLSTKRLLPFEMIDLLRPKLPNSILFTRVVTRSLNSIEIQARTSIASDFNAFRTALASQTNIVKVDVTNSSIRDGSTTFTLLITFKPGAVMAAEDIPPPPVEKPKSAARDAAPASGEPPSAGAAQAPAAAPSIHEQIRQQTDPDQPPPDDPPPASPQPQTSPAPGGEPAAAPASYTTASGDTIAIIARKNGISPEDILAANPDINPRRLSVGQKLNLPKNASLAVETVTEEPVE